MQTSIFKIERIAPHHPEKKIFEIIHCEESNVISYEKSPLEIIERNNLGNKETLSHNIHSSSLKGLYTNPVIMSNGSGRKENEMKDISPMDDVHKEDLEPLNELDRKSVV